MNQTTPVMGPALEAHCRRVGVLAAELSGRLGWSQSKRNELEKLVWQHHEPPVSGPVGRLLNDVFQRPGPTSNGGSFQPARLGSAGGFLRSANGGGAAGRLLELCCFFVERWEFAPYEPRTFEEVAWELDTLADDGFLEKSHVRQLRSLPGAGIQKMQAIASRLRPFPVAAIDALRLARDPCANGQDFEALIGGDPKLVEAVVRAAGTATLRDAVLEAGLPACCRILAQAALRPFFASRVLDPLWAHSVEVAEVAGQLAQMSSQADPEEAFLAGLVHDVGRLPLWNLRKAEAARYSALMKTECEASFAEVVLCGFDHGAAGGEVLRHWGFPQPIVEAVEQHHRPEGAGALGQHLYLAEHWCASEEDAPSLARLRVALENTKLTAGQIMALSQATHSSMSRREP